MLIFKFDYSQSTHVPYEYFILYTCRVAHDTFVLRWRIQRAALIQAMQTVWLAAHERPDLTS